MNLFLATEGGGFEVPPVEELFEFAPMFGEGTLFAFNRVGMLYLIAGAITIGLMLAAFRSPDLVPGRFQAAMESLVEFVREQIVVQVIGPDGLRYVPILTAFFLFILINNLFEVTPLVQLPPTGRMAVPALLAVIVWTMFVAEGVRSQGVGGYLKSVMLPPGVPWYALVLVVPIELVSTFIVRPFTHAIRLFANMMAGHILLAIVFIAANAFLVDFHNLYELGPITFNAGGSILGVVMLAAGAAAVAFEAMVGLLQAYIFTILAAVYLASSMHPEH